jgi:hypothetical protein
MHWAHILFLATGVIVALTPLLLAKGRGALFAPVWLGWIGVWGAIATMSALGMFSFPLPILRLVPHLGGQILVGAALFVLVPSSRAAVRSIPSVWLVRWQQAPVIGGFFLIAAVMGKVP